MKKYFILALAVVTLGITSCNNGTTNESENNNEIDSLEQVLNQKEDEMNELMDRLGEIQEGLDQISDAEGRIGTLTSGEVPVGDVTADIEENLQFIENTMANNRQRISELQVKLNSSTINTTRLQQQLASLEKRFNEKVEEINALKEELIQKDIQIKTLTDTVASLVIKNTKSQAANDAKQKMLEQQQAEINKATTELNTAYYVYGTKTELRKHGILSNSKFRMSEETDASYFTKIDIRKFKTLPLDSKSVELLSTHPEKSYAITKDANNRCVLNIIDSKAFWSTSKYLVVKVK